MMHYACYSSAQGVLDFIAAAADGNVRILGELLDQAATAKHINITDGNRCSDCTTLHDTQCCSFFWLNIVLVGLTGSKGLIGCGLSNCLLLHRTALILAIEGNHAEAVSVLIKAGADINQSVAEDDTPLHMAIRYSHHAVAMLLIQHQSIAINAKVSACIAPSLSDGGSMCTPHLSAHHGKFAFMQ